MAPVRSDRRLVLLLYPIVVGLILICINVRLGFHQLHNDFWDNWFLARHLTFSDLQTLFNPLFPIGYTAFLKLIVGDGYPVVPAILANIACASTILLVSAVFYLRRLSLPAAAFSVIALSMYPRFFFYVNAGGADPASVLFFTSGAVLILGNLIKTPDKGSWFYFICGGLLLGAGALFRYHTLECVVLFLISIALVYRNRILHLIVAFAGVLVAYSLQFTVNSITGHHLFEVAYGPVNVYDLMYGVNWYKSTSFSYPSSIFTIIMQDPWLFIRHYAAAFASFAPGYLPLLAAAALARDSENKKLYNALALWTLAYFAVFSAFTSGRQILLPLPFAMLGAGFVLQELVQRGGAVKKTALTGAFSLLMVFIIKDVEKITIRAREHAEVSRTEAALISLGCKEARSVFTTDYDFYLKTMPQYLPFFNGGAPRWVTYRYNEEYPEFPVENVAAFACACRERGIRFAVLTRNGALLSQDLGIMYEKGAPEFILRSEIGRFRIFELAAPQS
jgi:hypothetical protein